jgi:chromosome segregation ATPase
MKESQIADLRQNISTQQTATSQAQTKLKTSLEEMEKLKKDFKADRNSWDTEKAALLKRAEEAEAALKPVAEELSGLKCQIGNMTAAIFGK